MEENCQDGYYVIALIFVGFVVYQVEITVKSYVNPIWSSEEEDRTSVAFPGVIICPTISRAMYFQTISHNTCTFYPGGDENATSCLPETIYLEVENFKLGKDILQECLTYNMNDSAMAFGVDAFFQLTVKVKTHNTSELAGLLDSYGLSNITVFPLYIQFYSPELGVPTRLRPSVAVSVYSTNFFTMSRTEYWYENGTLDVEYDFTESSTPNLTPGYQLLIYLSLSSSRVTIWQQIVAYDAITMVGIVAGCLGFARSIYVVIFIIVDKIHNKITGKPKKKANDETEPLLSQRTSINPDHDEDEDEDEDEDRKI